MFLHPNFDIFWKSIKILFNMSVKSVSHTFVSFGTAKAITLIEPISESFYKDTVLPKFRSPLLALQKSRAVQ